MPAKFPCRPPVVLEIYRHFTYRASDGYHTTPAYLTADERHTIIAI